MNSIVTVVTFVLGWSGPKRGYYIIGDAPSSFFSDRFYAPHCHPPIYNYFLINKAQTFFVIESVPFCWNLSSLEAGTIVRKEKGF